MRCRGCGCSEADACVDVDGVPCGWLYVDVEAGEGVCSSLSCVSSLTASETLLLVRWAVRGGSVPVVVGEAPPIRFVDSEYFDDEGALPCA